MGSLPGPGGSHPATIASAVHLDLVVVVQAEFYSRPAAIASAVRLDQQECTLDSGN